MAVEHVELDYSYAVVWQHCENDGQIRLLAVKVVPAGGLFFDPHTHAHAHAQRERKETLGFDSRGWADPA